jgi:hypothetical protein
MEALNPPLPAYTGNCTWARSKWRKADGSGDLGMEGIAALAAVNRAASTVLVLAAAPQVHTVTRSTDSRFASRLIHLKSSQSLSARLRAG